MSIDTATFVAGVGVLVTLDLAVLTISVANTRSLGSTATEKQVSRVEAAVREAEEQAQAAHERLTLHLRRSHDKDVETAREAAQADRRESRGD